jgi:integrase
MKARFYLKGTLVMMDISDPQFASGRFRYSTREHIDPAYWEKGRVRRTKDGKYNHIQVRLEELSTKATKYITMNRDSLTRKGLQEELDRSRPKEKVTVTKPTMMEEFRDFLAIKKAKRSKSTHNGYRITCDLFEKFLIKRGLKRLMPEDFTFKQLEEFQVFLGTTETQNTDEEGKPVIGYGYNSIQAYTKRLMLFVGYLTKIGRRTQVSRDDVKIKEVPGVKIALTEEELDAMELLRLEGDMEKYRDLFLLQCLTGLRISDLMRVDRNIKGTRISLETRKVRGNYVDVPITTRAGRIIEKYDYKLPRITRSEYWKHVKQIYRQVNPTGTIQVREGEEFVNRYVWQEISSHDAVRTFVTLSAQRGMSIPDIAQIVGKTVEILLKNYLVHNQEQAEKSFHKAWG